MSAKRPRLESPDRRGVVADSSPNSLSDLEALFPSGDDSDEEQSTTDEGNADEGNASGSSMVDNARVRPKDDFSIPVGHLIAHPNITIYARGDDVNYTRIHFRAHMEDFDHNTSQDLRDRIRKKPIFSKSEVVFDPEELREYGKRLERFGDLTKLSDKQKTEVAKLLVYKDDAEAHHQSKQVRPEYIDIKNFTIEDGELLVGKWKYDHDVKIYAYFLRNGVKFHAHRDDVERSSTKFTTSNGIVTFGSIIFLEGFVRGDEKTREVSTKKYIRDILKKIHGDDMSTVSGATPSSANNSSFPPFNADPQSSPHASIPSGLARRLPSSNLGGSGFKAPGLAVQAAISNLQAALLSEQNGQAARALSDARTTIGQQAAEISRLKTQISELQALNPDILDGTPPNASGQGRTESGT